MSHASHLPPPDVIGSILGITLQAAQTWKRKVCASPVGDEGGGGGLAEVAAGFEDHRVDRFFVADGEQSDRVDTAVLAFERRDLSGASRCHQVRDGSAEAFTTQLLLLLSPADGRLEAGGQDPVDRAEEIHQDRPWAGRSGRNGRDEGAGPGAD